ncbi:MAG: FtsK/SpoIIIE domain-containing protein [Fulvivirga sp.]
MKLTNSKTSEFLAHRTILWDLWKSTRHEHETITSQLEKITSIGDILSFNDYKELTSYPENAKNVYSTIKSNLDKSNQLKEKILSISGEIASGQKAVQGRDDSITASNKKIEEAQINIQKLRNNITICYVLIFLIVPFFLINGFKEKIVTFEKEIQDAESKKQADFDKKASLDQKKTLFQEEINSIEKNLGSIKQETLNLASELSDLLDLHHQSLLNKQHESVLETLNKEPPFRHYRWSPEVWNRWDVDQMELNSDLCIGYYNETILDELHFRVPAYAPFIGQQKTIFLSGDDSKTAEINSMMESMAIRLAMQLPHKVKFTFLDPSGFGKAFPISGKLETRESTGDVYRILENIMDEMHRIINKYGLSDDRPFNYEPDNILLEQRFECIFAAAFPKQYDRRVIESLMRIANTGHIAGKYVILHHNSEVDLPRDIFIEGFEKRFLVSMNNLSSYGDSSYEFIPDNKPVDDLKLKILEDLRVSKPKVKNVEWQDEIAIPKDNWWTKSAVENIETPIGRSGRTDKLDIWFGARQNEGGRPCSHGMLGAMTGSGKSNLYHVLILGMAIRYSPKELTFYLIDGKDGVEFQPYKYLPHAQFVSLKSQPKLSRSILAELLEEKERRNNLFTSYQVNDYESFRRHDAATEVLPRILLMVDEYQELFEGDKEGISSNHLLALAQQGRSAGIHMLLGSQRFGVVGMMHQSAIFGNIHLRIAMKMSLSDRQALIEFGREGKQEIAECNLPGKAVINDQSGDDGANKPGMVALMSKTERHEVIKEISTMAKAMDDVPTELLTTNIFHGSEQPNLLDNPQLSFLVRNSQWLSDDEMQTFANKEIHEGGLGEISWFAGERPIVGWIGQEFNVRGQTKIILRRRQRENLIIVGDYNEARFGMLTGLLASFALMASPKQNQFHIIDKTIPGAPWNTALRDLKDELLDPIGCEINYAVKSAEAESVFSRLMEVLKSRLQTEEDDRLKFGNIYLCIADPDKLEALCQIPNKYGNMEDSKLGLNLQEIYIKGPSVGIFTILAVESVMSFFNIISKRNLDYFRHRVALQMSEDDSFTFVKRREASKLQLEWKKPICGFYLDVSNNRHSTFKSYCLGEEMKNQVIEIRDLIKNR